MQNQGGSTTNGSSRACPSASKSARATSSRRGPFTYTSARNQCQISTNPVHIRCKSGSARATRRPGEAPLRAHAPDTCAGASIPPASHPPCAGPAPSCIRRLSADPGTPGQDRALVPGPPARRGPGRAGLDASAGLRWRGLPRVLGMGVGWKPKAGGGRTPRDPSPRAGQGAGVLARGGGRAGGRKIDVKRG